MPAASLTRGLLVAVLFAAVVPIALRTLRRERLWLVSLPAAAFYFGAAFPGFLLVSAIGYAAAHALTRVQDRAVRWRWTGAALVVVIVLFTAGRVYSWDQRSVLIASGWQLFYCTFDMWLVLRVGTLLWETGSGAIELPSGTEYAGWVGMPLTLGGPLVRYSELPRAVGTRPTIWLNGGWWRDVIAAIAKLGLGLVLGAVPALIGERWPDARLLKGAVIVFVSGPLGFYLTLAGYYHLVQMLGRSAGYAIPDSFNWPIGRENIAQFWANWNITATRVFREYVFFSRWGLRRHNVFVNTLLVFVLVGLWHGANAYWILWGLLHGIWFCGFILWSGQASRWQWLPSRKTAASSLLARAVTYVGICATWYLPSKIMQKLGAL